LGKIFDALEKSKKRLQAPVIINDTSVSPEVFDNFENVNLQKQVAAVESSKALSDKNKIDKNLITLLKPQSFESEQFKILRISLLFPASGKPARSIMVTSAVPGEGKSFVAANLAVSIAQSINEHVLLMDCDIRKPRIQSCFGFSNVPGISDYLASKTPLSSLLLKTVLKKLTILPGGKPVHNPSELLSSKKMSELLDEVKTRYKDRYIIIDSPPPRFIAESNAIAKQVDGIIVVVKYGSTSREAVKDLVESLRKEKILGVIVNRFDLSSLNNYYNYGAYKNYYKNYK
jgi:exopolysaccharide/PEP-CTERM locus tyrosine autokinase